MANKHARKTGASVKQRKKDPASQYSAAKLFKVSALVLLAAELVHLQLLSQCAVAGILAVRRPPAHFPWGATFFVAANLAPALIIVAACHWLARRAGPLAFRVAWYQPTLLSTILAILLLGRSVFTDGLPTALGANALAYGPVLIDAAIRRHSAKTERQPT